jgi:structural maintenance of chromosome 3 (chondroitin sulfate proteoglycan 6)
VQKRLLATAHNQVEAHRAGIASRRAEMETELIDSLTPQERSLLSSLNPEITQLKEQLVECKARRMDVRYFLLYLMDYTL